MLVNHLCTCGWNAMACLWPWINDHYIFTVCDNSFFGGHIRFLFNATLFLLQCRNLLWEVTICLKTCHNETEPGLKHLALILHCRSELNCISFSLSVLRRKLWGIKSEVNNLSKCVFNYAWTRFFLCVHSLVHWLPVDIEISMHISWLCSCLIYLFGVRNDGWK